MDKRQNKKTQATGWILIPPPILGSIELTANEKLLFGKILGLITNTGECFASNEWIGNELGLSKKTISGIISSLVDKGFLYRHLIRNAEQEIIKRTLTPNYEKLSTSPTQNNEDPILSGEDTPILQREHTSTPDTAYPIPQGTEDKKNTKEDNKYTTPNGVEATPIGEENSTKVDVSLQEKTLVVKGGMIGGLTPPTPDLGTKEIKKSTRRKKKEYGDPLINEVKAYFLEKMQIPQEDCSQSQSRIHWSHLLRESKRGVEGVKWLIDAAAEDVWLSKNITSSVDLYYKRVKLITRKRGAKPKIAVMPTPLKEVKS